MRRALLLSTVFFFAFAGLIGSGGYFWIKHAYYATGPLTEHRVVLVERGTSVMSIATDLEDAGLVDDALIFQYGTRYFGSGKPLRAGEFEIPAEASAAEVGRILQEGAPVVHKITLPEGLTSAEIIAVLNQDTVLQGEANVIPAEGALLPETYHFERGTSREEIVVRAERAMDETLRKLWNERVNGLPISTPEEAVILASIVEKETGVAAERPLVASVFINRLRRGMRLQSDPTVLYGITEGSGPLGRALTRTDLDQWTPYNTYQIKGLPPGPIANPGRASLAAVLQPAETDYLYFVADGTGGHAFGKTLDEHNTNVRAWRKLQRAN